MKIDKQPTNRRSFLTKSLLFSAAAGLYSSPLLSSTSEFVSSLATTPTEKSLHILILGGTSFLGPHQIAYALDRGHKVSIFTRGKTTPRIHKELFSKVEHLVGDREDNLEALKNRKWDAVIDNSGRKVQWTKDSAELLKDNVKYYLYTSSTGVYYPYLGDDISEETKLNLENPVGKDDIRFLEYDYGVMKSKSEQEALKAFGKGRCMLVRPTYMMGPGDRTDRFTYWPVRLAKGGDILVPGKKEDPVQYIDVRDVAEWMIRLLENGTTGTFNAVGPSSKTTMQQFIYAAHGAFSSPAKFTFIPDYDFLIDNEIYYSVPWIMPTDENYGSARVNNSHSVVNGLTFRPISQSIKDIHTWWYSDAVQEERRQKMETGEKSLMKREASILEKWKNRN